MHSEHERQAKLQKIKDLLQELTQLTPESLVRTDKLGTALDFSKAVPLFEGWTRLFKDVDSIDLSCFPIPIIEELISILDSAKVCMNGIRGFDSSNLSDPSGMRDKIITRLESKYGEGFQKIIPIIAYARTEGVAFHDIEKRIKDNLNEITSLNKRMEKLGEVAQSSLSEMQKAAAQYGVEQYAYRFEAEAKKHVFAKRCWLLATLVLVVIIFIVAYFFIDSHAKFTDEMNPIQLIQLTISKFMVFGALFYALAWSGRIYRAESHNAVVNKHRQNALKTFEVFVEASNDEQTRNAVLLQATQSIFSHQPSGFSQGDKDESSAKVVEIVRNVMPDKGSQG